MIAKATKLNFGFVSIRQKKTLSERRLFFVLVFSFCNAFPVRKTRRVRCHVQNVALTTAQSFCFFVL